MYICPDCNGSQIMIPFELSNFQRAYFGLDPIEKHWERVPFSGDNYRPQSILYFDGDTLKRHITSTDTIYSERQYNDLTKGRKILLPKTERGREKKLTAAVLEQRQPTGVYLSITEGSLTIGNYNTQTTFYSSRWEKAEQSDKNIPDIVSRFIEQSPESHVEEITLFKKAKRESVKFKTGDYFSFRLDRVSFGFGRVLLDINKVRNGKNALIDHSVALDIDHPELMFFQAREKSCLSS